MSFSFGKSGVLLWCCVVFVCLLLDSFVTITYATGVVKFEQANGGGSSDNIYELLEDEQLFVVSGKSSQGGGAKASLKSKAKPPANSSSVALPSSKSSSSSSSKQSLSSQSLPALSSSSSEGKSGAGDGGGGGGGGGGAGSVSGGVPVSGEARLDGSRDTTASRHLGQSAGVTSHLSHGEHLREEEAEMVFDDFLIVSQDREEVELAQEMERMDQEQELARRVRRAITVGSGTNDVQGEITVNITWSSDFLDSNTTAYQNLSAAALASLQTIIDNSTPTITITITGFREENGTVVICIYVDYPNGGVDRRALALLFLDWATFPFQYGDDLVEILGDPYLTTDTDTLRSSRCYLCRNYQACLRNNANRWICRLQNQELFGFAEATAASTLERGVTKANVEILLEDPIYVENEDVSSVFISLYGLISFGKKFNSFVPRDLPRRKKKLFCGYWANMELALSDTRSQVWYQSVIQSEGNTVVERDLLQSGKTAVESYYNGSVTIDPTFMLIVTYEDMPAGPYTNSATDERVNFQLVVIADDIRTYGMIIYVQGGMLWTEAEGRVTIGYMSTMLGVDANRPDLFVGNTNRRGVWLVPLGEEPQPSAKKLCRRWYKDNLRQFPRSVYMIFDAIQPSCPCSARLASVLLFPDPDRSDCEFGDCKNKDVVCFLMPPNIVLTGKRCCYQIIGNQNERATFIRKTPKSGSFILNHPYISPSLYYSQDEDPHRWCCLESNQCQRFFRIRPSNRCRRVRIRRASTFGDPHVVTPDGMYYPFNAIGEFKMMDIKQSQPNLQFDLQARTCQGVSADDVPIAASVFCAFVAKGNSSNVVQVELLRSKDGVSLLVDKQDLTNAFRSEGNGFRRTKQDQVTVKRSNNSVLISFSEGIDLNITASFRLLTIGLSLGENITGSSGLLGNMDNDPNNDFVFPNGTVLPADASDKTLFEYGQTWALTDSTTLFEYQQGYNTAAYTNTSFMPLFLSDVDNATKANAETVCGGSTDQACIFDYIVTNDTALAVGSKNVETQLASDRQIIANNPPTVSGPESIQVKLNKSINIVLNATDAEDSQTPNYVFVDQPSTGFTFDNSTQTATWTPSSNATSKLEVAVEDSIGDTSSTLQINILYCSGCNSQGTCNYTELRTPPDTTEDSFQLAACVCKPYWTGDDCELDFDACEDDPCPQLTTCTDIPATEHEKLGPDNSGYNCSSCPTGYVANVTSTNDFFCLDVDECAGSPCDQNCTNSIGSFTCSCTAGYRLNPLNKTDCKDIDECAENTHDCDQKCVNTVGSYMCQCIPGFTRNTTTNKCDKDAAQDPCAGLSNSCTYGCKNDSGTAVCVCPSGYTLAGDGFSCKDAKECNQSPCSQVCEDTVGSYACSCHAGYQLGHDKLTCTACSGFDYGMECNATCDCRGKGRCDAVRGCICDAGWSGVNCNQDVDECSASVSPCSAQQTCLNTLGSYACNCPSGYSLVNVTQCQDIDECAQPNLNNCTAVEKCVNTKGSYTCDCIQGYTYVNNTCQDVDECETNTDSCEQVCVNFPGSANCACNEGYVINDDRKTCSKERDPCEVLGDTKNCTYGCKVVNGQAECFCKSGFRVAVDGVSCYDFDECQNSSYNLCNQMCENSPGSYVCSCNDGFSLQNDERTCTACDEFHWGPGCTNDCNCSPTSTIRCNSVVGCECKSGWLGATCEQDRDDCQSNPCQANALCTDTAGSYSCDCIAGYAAGAGPTSSCEDVDECAQSPCDQTCTNTNGSYVCSCSSGFTSEGDKCKDFNECLNNPCEQLCINTIGSYLCDCRPGYSLNATTRKTCYAQQTCTNSPCEQDCALVNGSPECSCMAGYQVNATDPNSCTDIDECSTSSPCTNGNCTNTNGGFTCTCDPGTKLLSDKVTCEVCAQGTYGTDCNTSCSCITANTATCSPGNGDCNCKTGWEGLDCSQDVDECPTACSGIPNSQCVNKNGTYQCDCKRGFSSSNGQCIPCDDTSYGDQCALPCPCKRANTKDCDDRTGVCDCNDFWKGANCTEDVNECSSPAVNPCNATLMEECQNSIGGYSCNCATGYNRPSPGALCTDLNECLYPNLNTCNLTVETCVNSVGNFSCVCKSGFGNATGTCEDVDECQTSQTCSQFEDCTNNYGSYTCSCSSGYTATNNFCVDINECSQSLSNNCTTNEQCVNENGGYRCDCASGYTRHANGLCRERVFNTTLRFRLNMANESSLHPGSAYYNTLSNLIRQALLAAFQPRIGAYLYDVLILGLSYGSVVVDSELQLNATATENPQGLAAKAVQELLAVGTLDVNGTARIINEATVDGTPMTQNSTPCNVFSALQTCAADQVCQTDASGLPVCAAVEDDDDNLELIIGLGVGLPLFFIAVVVVAFVIYSCVKKRKAASADSVYQPEPSDHRFPSIFAGQVATKGSWGAAHRYQMYSPDNMSVSHASESSGEGQLLKGRRQGRSDFQDSAWYDNRRGVSVDPTSPRGDNGRDGATDGGTTSNFSWEYMFRLLAPYRGGFEIQRPNVDTSPNPAYTPRGPRPDSMA